LKLCKELSFAIGEALNYDPHGIISSRRKDINASDYEHEYKPKLEWKVNLHSWPINIEMEVKTPATKEKSQKRSIDDERDTVMEDASSTKK